MTGRHLERNENPCLAKNAGSLVIALEPLHRLRGGQGEEDGGEKEVE